MTSKWGHSQVKRVIVSFLSIFSLQCPSILDLGPGKGRKNVCCPGCTIWCYNGWSSGQPT